jgi:hypothetical protein
VTGAPLKVEKGVLDLRHIRQGDAFTVKMNGEWEFYFNTFLYATPDFSNDTLSSSCYGKVPGYWSTYEINGKRLPRFGYGTYRAVILLPPGYHDRMGFDMPLLTALKWPGMARLSAAGLNQYLLMNPCFLVMFLKMIPLSF